METIPKRGYRLVAEVEIPDAVAQPSFRRRRFWIVVMGSVAAMAEQDPEAAEWEAQEIGMLAPDFRTAEWLATYPMVDSAQRDRLAKLLEPLGF
jgi:hypothetical protein